MKKILVPTIIFVLFSCMTFYISCEATHESSESNSSQRVISALEISSLQILDEHCSSCHGPGGSNDGGFSSVLNVNSMLLEGYLIPESPLQSSLFTEIQNGTMPTSYQLSLSDMNVINQWIVEFNLSNNNSTEGNPARDFGKLNTTILEPKCLECHNRNNAETPLTSYTDVSLIIVPGYPQYSLLIDTLKYPERDSHIISNEDLEFLVDWVTRGAPL